MVTYLADAGHPISFGEWVKLGLPLVPVLALTVAAYMYLRCKPRLLVRNVNPSEVVQREVAGIPKFGGREAIMAAILGHLVITWVTLDDRLGLGGATLIAVGAMFLFRIISWEDVQRGVAFDVVGLYAAAGAIAVGLSFTGGGVWLASRILDMLPASLSEGDGLVMGVSVLTVLLTNVMSDGATVGTLGPIVLPMADLGHASTGARLYLESGPDHFIRLFVRQRAGGGDPEQCHRLRDEQGPRDRGKATECIRLHQVWSSLDRSADDRHVGLGAVRLLVPSELAVARARTAGDVLSSNGHGLHRVNDRAILLERNNTPAH